MPPSLSFLVLPRVDSIMLVEEGFNVTSVDASDKMLKYALKERWNRRHDPAFDKWGTWVQPGVLSSLPWAPLSIMVGSCFPQRRKSLSFP